MTAGDRADWTPGDPNPTEDVFERERQLADARAAMVAHAVRRAADNVSGSVFLAAVVIAVAILIG